MKLRSLYTLLLTAIFIYSGTGQVMAASDQVPISKRNKVCLNCHGSTYFSYFNEYLGRDVKERMNPYYMIDSAQFMISNHRTFDCTDCHSTEYGTFPHPNQLRFEPMAACMD